METQPRQQAASCGRDSQSLPIKIEIMEQNFKKTSKFIDGKRDELH